MRSEESGMLILYKQALQTLVNDFVYPNGSAADMSFIEEQDFSENQFAICDMDGDGIVLAVCNL